MDAVLEKESRKGENIMFDKFGEFESVEELNRAAAAQRKEGDEEALLTLAKENGIDEEDAEDFMDGCVEMLATPLMAAMGKLKLEAEELKLEGILTDWKDQLITECMNTEKMQIAVRKKGKRLAQCMARLIKFAFENKVQVSDEIVNITKVMHNGKEESMRNPLYLGIPNKVQVQKIINDYYLG